MPGRRGSIRLRLRSWREPQSGNVIMCGWPRRSPRSPNGATRRCAMKRLMKIGANHSVGRGKELAKYRDQRVQWESNGTPTGKVKGAQAGPRNLKQTQSMSREQITRTGDVQPGRTAKEPVNARLNKASRKQGEVQTGRITINEKPSKASKKSGEVQATRTPKRQKQDQTSQVTEPRKQKIPKSPVAGKRGGASGQNVTPPGPA